MELRQEQIPAPGRDQILVRALYSAISHGTELLVYRGQVDPDLALDLPTLDGSFRFPIKYGYASVGRIESVGDAVTGLKAGDLVFVHHPHQSAYVVPARAAVPVPVDVEPEAAALLANLETAINITLDAHVAPGDRVVVFGQGVVGLLVTQLLRRAGVQTIAVVDPIAQRRELARQLGVDVALVPAPALRDHIMKLSEGRGVDLAIEVSGNPAALDLAIDCVRFQGTIVVASWYGTKPATLHLGGAFHRNRLRIVSSQVSHMDPALAPQWTPERRRQTAVELLREISWKPLITHRFDIESAAAAYQLLDEKGEGAVQVLFTYV